MASPLGFLKPRWDSESEQDEVVPDPNDGFSDLEMERDFLDLKSLLGMFLRSFIMLWRIKRERKTSGERRMKRRD